MTMMTLEREEIAIALIVDGVHLTDDEVKYTMDKARIDFLWSARAGRSGLMGF